jgi:hypothetical protein
MTSFLRFLVLVYVRTMDNVQNPSNSECYKQSEPFRVCLHNCGSTCQFCSLLFRKWKNCGSTCQFCSLLFRKWKNCGSTCQFCSLLFRKWKNKSCIVIFSYCFCQHDRSGPGPECNVRSCPTSRPEIWNPASPRCAWAWGQCVYMWVRGGTCKPNVGLAVHSRLWQDFLSYSVGRPDPVNSSPRTSTCWPLTSTLQRGTK